MVKALKASSIALTIVAALAGCAVGPNYKRPETRVAPQFAGAEASTYETTQDTQVQFWRQFDDDTLDQLVSDALTANHDLRIALGNLVEARGSRRESLYDLAPTVTAAGGYTKQLTPATEFGFPFSSSYYQAGFDATWELDFFGQVRRGIEARTAQVQGAQASLRDARVSVIAEVARTYFELRGQQTQLEVAQRNVVNETDTLKLTQARLDAGDFSCFRQGLFKRNSLHFAALYIGNSAPSLIVPSLIDRRVVFAVLARNILSTRSATASSGQSLVSSTI